MTSMMSQQNRHVVAAKKAKVAVTATKLAADPWVRFAMHADYPDKGGKQKDDDLEFDAQAGAFEVTFNLDDKSGLQLAFYPDFADAIWVAVGENCPTGPGNGGGVITPVSVSDKKLVVTNANAVGQTLTFALRFTGTASDGGFPPYVYDPRMINGGGDFVEQSDN